MADEIALGIAVGQQHLGQQADHLVPAPITILVVEWLEVVQVRVTRDELGLVAQEAADVLTDGHVAGQEGQGIGVAGRLDAHFSHRAHELIAGAQADITAVLCHDETVGQIALVFRCQHADQFVDLVFALDDPGLRIGVQHAGLAAPDLAVVEPAVFVHEQQAVDDRHRPTLVDHSDRVQLALLHEYLGQIIAGGRVRDDRCLDDRHAQPLAGL